MSVTAEEAQTIALEYLSTGKVKDIELEKKEKRYVYEIEVKINGDDGDIYIDAMTGDILHVEDDLRETLGQINKSNKKVTEKQQNVGISKVANSTSPQKSKTKQTTNQPTISRSGN